MSAENSNATARALAQGQFETAATKSLRMQRCRAEEIDAMESGDDRRMRQCVLGTLSPV